MGGCLSLKCGAWSLLVGVLLCFGIQYWMLNKAYIFDANQLAKITNEALKTSKGGDHEVVFDLVEKELRHHYGDHILHASHMEWLFVNAGGWMGAMKLLHASATEYVLFFGTAVDTSGHSGRYWANITDTVISGKFIQWPEGTTRPKVFTPGETVFHGVGEAAGMQWVAPFWAVEYGRGFIPSTLGFALSDSLFSTQDLYSIYRTLRVYSIALAQEILQGNL